jgi:MFS family permease
MVPQTSVTSRAAWVVVAMLWIVALLNYLDRNIVTAMGEPVKAAFSLGDAQFGLVSSTFMWVYGACSLFAGYAADRFGRRPVIFASLAIWSAATFATGSVLSFEGMLAARAIMGVSEAFYMPAAVALIAEYHRGSTRSRATALHLSGTHAGAICGGLGGLMADEVGWRAAFHIFGAIGVGYALVLIAFLPRPPEGGAGSETPRASDPAPAGGASSGLAARGFLLLLVMSAFDGAALWTLRNWLPEFFRTELGVASRWAGLLGTSAFSAAAFAGMVVASSLSDRWSRTHPRARTLIPGAWYVAAAVAFVVLGTTASVPVLVGCVLVAGSARGSLDANLMPAVCTQVSRRYWATGYGLLNFAGTTAGGAMTFAGGWLKDQNVPLSATFQMAGGLVLVAGVCLLVVRPVAVPHRPNAGTP